MKVGEESREDKGRPLSKILQHSKLEIITWLNSTEVAKEEGNGTEDYSEIPSQQVLTLYEI